LLTDVSADLLAKTVSTLGPRAEGYLLDVTDPEQWRRLADHLRATAGRPDALVNNAGIVVPAAIGDTSLADLERAMSVNVGGTFLGIRTFLELHRETASTRNGSIVNIASVRGLVGGANALTYCASKFGVRGITKAAAVELGPLGIRVNAICPGPIESDMSRQNPDFADMDWDGYSRRLPLGHMGQPPDVGAAAAWLVSDASAFVTGIDLPVDGGLTATSYTVESKPTSDRRPTDSARAGATTTHHKE
jgi:3alpha(or 20beta)-hydroxysteroid dehydrogenase